MKAWKPRPAPGVKASALPLSMEAGFVLSRLDGQTSVGDLGLLTGLPEPQIAEALRLLLQHGALQAEGVPAELGGPAAEARPPSTPPAARPPSAPPPAEPAPEEAPAEEEEEAGEEDPALRGDYRKLYEAELRDLPADVRAAEARTASGDRLCALCYDPLPEVARAVLENPGRGLSHARLLAAHHRTGSGLEALLARAELARDAQVRRLLLRNPQLSEGMLTRLLAGQRLLPLFKVAMSHEVTEQVKRGARNLVRARFGACGSEEKVEALFATEGRLLPLLIGVGLDGRTAQLLCERQYSSPMLVQGLAKWPPTPQMVLRHLLRQPLVARSKPLRDVVRQHPNAPKERE